jgi:hypothetical protein
MLFADWSGMRFPGAKSLTGDTRWMHISFFVTGLLMAAPAFIGWAQFRPAASPLTASSWYGAYISSPLGLGSGPHHTGWLLMVLAGTGFVVVSLPTIRVKCRGRVLRLVAMSALLSLYAVLIVGQEVQISHWTDVASGSGCLTWADGVCVESTNSFRSPSGRVLTVIDTAWGWGFGIGLLAVVIGGFASVILASYFNDSLGPDLLSKMRSDTTLYKGDQ